MKYNFPEKSWERICHISIFTYEGEVKEGPTINSIKSKNRKLPKELSIISILNLAELRIYFLLIYFLISKATALTIIKPFTISCQYGLTPMKVSP